MPREKGIFLCLLLIWLMRTVATLAEHISILVWHTFIDDILGAIAIVHTNLLRLLDPYVVDAINASLMS